MKPEVAERTRIRARERYQRIKNDPEVRARAKDYYLRRRADPVKLAADRAAYRARHLKYDFGLTVEEFDALLSEQGGGCGVCGVTESAGRGFHVDHCHKTGVIRGILCHYCNLGLGNLKDDPELVARALDYLRRTG